MAYFKPNQTDIIVDVNAVGMGVRLTKTIKKRKEKVVCYASKTVTEIEQLYSHIKREMPAELYTVDHFHL